MAASIGTGEIAFEAQACSRTFYNWRSEKHPILSKSVPGLGGKKKWVRYVVSLH